MGHPSQYGGYGNQMNQSQPYRYNGYNGQQPQTNPYSNPNPYQYNPYR